MNKLLTFIRYSVDFLKHFEVRYFIYSLVYILKNKTPNKSGYYRSSLGKFYVRKGTLDFQFANYAYEWGVKKFVYKHINNYDIFLDIGANIGTYSVLFAGKGLTGFAFEPIKSNFEALKTNLGLNHLSEKVKLLPVGLGSYKHRANFTFDPVNTGASHLTDDHIDAEIIINPEFEDTDIETLDGLMEVLDINTEKRIILKIDVEGMELDVLKGATNFLKKYPHVLLIIESVHSGKEKITALLQSIASFEILEVDALNMAAKKL